VIITDVCGFTLIIADMCVDLPTY